MAIKERGRILDADLTKKSRVSLGSVTLEGGNVVEGVIKLYRDLPPAAKEARILDVMATERSELPLARVLSYQEVKGREFEREGWRYLLAETEIKGPKIADETEPVPLGQARRDAEVLFDQLGAVSSHKQLVAEGVGYCGDLSSLNIKRTPKGYVIVDWSSADSEDVVHVTPRYIPPEVFRGEKPSEVNRDIFALGSVLTRVLLGRDKFRTLFPDGGERTFLQYKSIVDRVPGQTEDFFRTALAEDPSDRTPEGATADEIYQELKKLFMQL